MEKVGEMIFFVFVAFLSRIQMVTYIYWGKVDTIGLTGAAEKKRGFWASFLLNPRKENNSTDQKIYGWIFKYIPKQNL